LAKDVLNEPQSMDALE